MIALLGRVLGSELRPAYRRYLATLVGTGICQGIAYLLLVPVLGGLLRGDLDSVWPWLGGLAVAVLLAGALGYLQQQQGFALGLAASTTLRHQLGDRLSVLPLAWFDRDRVGQVGQLVGKGVGDVMNVPAHLLASVITTAITPLTVVIGVLIVDWRLGLVAATTLPIVYLALRWAASLMQRVEGATAGADAEAGSRTVELALLQPVLRSAGRSGSHELDAALVAQHRAGRRLLRAIMPGLGAGALAVQLSFTVILAVGTLLAINDVVQPAVLIALLVVAIRFAEPLAAAGDYAGAIRAARNSLERIDEVLSAPVLPEPATSAPTAGADVELQGVSFGYHPGQEVLHSVDLQASRGSLTAIVGPSGAGKSTLLRLIARFADVTGGRVLVGGVDVRELTTDDLMAMITIVTQDVYLFEGSILENVRVGRPEAGDDEVRRAAAQARLDEVVDRLPDGWDTEVGEGGAALSGGERQRVAIARALLKDTPIVLLDEATAALDGENEAAITAALQELAQGRTILASAHRLSTIAAAGQIVVIDGGRVVESGTHRDLLAAGGKYADFWRERTTARGWQLAGAAGRSSSETAGA